MEENFLTTLPPELCQMRSLTFLTLNSNQISMLPDNFRGNDGLSMLDCTDNKVVSIPLTLREGTHIEFFKCLSNHTQPQASKKAHTHTCCLYTVSYNRIEQLPLGFFTMPGADNITGLSLNHNRITTIPREISNLVNLQELSRLLTTLSTAILAPAHRRQLFAWLRTVDYNLIESVPEELLQLQHLDEIHRLCFTASRCPLHSQSVLCSHCLPVNSCAQPNRHAAKRDSEVSHPRGRLFAIAITAQHRNAACPD